MVVSYGSVVVSKITDFWNMYCICVFFRCAVKNEFADILHLPSLCCTFDIPTITVKIINSSGVNQVNFNYEKQLSQFSTKKFITLKIHIILYEMVKS